MLSIHEKIILVMDNVNTHVLASLYKCFPAPEARSYAIRLEIHYIPKHGSWLYCRDRTECYDTPVSCSEVNGAGKRQAGSFCRGKHVK